MSEGTDTLNLVQPAPAASTPTPAIDALRAVAETSAFDELADRFIAANRNNKKAPFGITREMLADALNRNFVSLEEWSDVTKEQAKNILRDRIWTPMLGEKLPPQVSAALFDIAVRRGIDRANKTAQKAMLRLKKMAAPVNGALDSDWLRAVAEMGADDVAEQVIAHRNTLVWRLGDGKLLGHDVDFGRAALMVGKLALKAKLGGLV
jgi:hypothetical protein